MKNYLAEAVHRIGDIPVGNPDEMRRYARQLRVRADSYRHLAREIQAAMSDSGLIKGGLADRLRHQGNDVVTSIDGHLANKVTALADYLEREATTLEAAQQSHMRRLRTLADQLLHHDQEEARRKAASRPGGGGASW